MCQILYSNDQIKNIMDLLSNKKLLEYELNKKGGDGYSFTLLWLGNPYSSYKSIISKGESFEDTYNDFFDKIFEELKKQSLFLFQKCHLVLFSRQKPEMEKSGLETMPPFINEHDWYWVHGTISNDKEVEKKLNKELTVDTEAIMFHSDLPENFIKGLYTYLEIFPDFDEYNIVNKGMGLWKHEHENLKIYSMDPQFNFKDGVFIKTEAHCDRPSDVYKNIYISFSGGMDISLSAYKVIDEIEKHISLIFNEDAIKINFIYFDYGNNSTQEEIAATEKFIELVKKDFPDYQYSFRIIDVKNIINGLASILDTNLKLTDKSSKGDERETEENLSYIPFRNSIFAEIIKSIAEKDGVSLGLIVFGLNLSEGQVFGDNNSAWMDNMENVLNHGGKFFTGFGMKAPYINRTKTNMIKEFVKEFGKNKFYEILNLSFSCYYPKNGEPCGECGSCILRKKALENLERKE